jgi:phosphoglycolate phosphatase-like HAD superfamily hydrolase
MRDPSLFLFDIDGTLLRGGTAVHRDAFAYAFRHVYGRALDLSGESAAGRTDTWLLAAPLRRSGMSDQEIWERMPLAFEAMQTYVEEHLGDLRDRVLAGVPEVLADLQARGQLLGLLTGNLSRIAMAKMWKAGLAQYFQTGGFGEESEIRTHLVPVALAKSGELAGHPIPPYRAVVVGDTPLDIEAGQLAETRTVGVATGQFGEEELRAAGADLVLPSLADADAAIKALLDVSYQVPDAGSSEARKEVRRTSKLGQGLDLDPGSGF